VLLGIARLAMVLGPLLAELAVNPLLVRLVTGRVVDVVMVRTDTRSLPEELP
jgi:hypothetical protein